jgi:Uma2 family endonuclease
VRTGRDNVRDPDASIDCGPLDLRGRLAAEPTVVFEVLSPPAWAVDLNEKLADDGATPSTRHYVVVAQDRPYVMVWNRIDGVLVRGAGSTTLSDVVDLAAVDVRLALADVYDEVTFDDAGDRWGADAG